MLVPRELLSSVVGIGVETPDGFNFTGIAYFVSIPSTLVPNKVHVYLVTAGHSVRARDNLVARLNAPDGGTMVDLLPPADRWLRLTDLRPASTTSISPRFAGTRAPRPRRDTGRCRWGCSSTRGSSETVEDVGVGIGDEVFADQPDERSVRAGAERSGGAHGQHRDDPVRADARSLRGGGPELRMRLYLTELHATAGLDGSPVFARPRGDRQRVADRAPGNARRRLGRRRRDRPRPHQGVARSAAQGSPPPGGRGRAASRGRATATRRRLARRRLTRSVSRRESRADA